MRFIVCVGLFFLCHCKTESAAPKEVVQPVVAAVPNNTTQNCVGSIGQGSVKTFQIGQHTYEINGSTLTQKTPSHEDELLVGVISDIKEDSADNLNNLKMLRQWFVQKGVKLIVVNGDSGQTREQIINVLSVIAEAKLPTLVTIGNREGLRDYKQALAALASDFPNMIDLSVIRRVDLPQADFISMPGYYNKAYVHAVDGCDYQSSDVEKLAEAVKVSNSPVVLISHGGPRQTGEYAIDRTSSGENVGDPALADLIQKFNIPFGIFGNIHEAGGKATDRMGTTIHAPNTWQTSLYLNPGPADSVRWEMNDKTESVGMGAILLIKQGKASYQMLRMSGVKKAS